MEGGPDVRIRSLYVLLISNHRLLHLGRAVRLMNLPEIMIE